MIKRLPRTIMMPRRMRTGRAPRFAQALALVRSLREDLVALAVIPALALVTALTPPPYDYWFRSFSFIYSVLAVGIYLGFGIAKNRYQ